jgi:hypothetical protein
MTHSGGELHNVGDKGQRYAVFYQKTEESAFEPFGYSDTYEGARQMLDSIALWPAARAGMFVDRDSN